MKNKTLPCEIRVVEKEKSIDTISEIDFRPFRLKFFEYDYDIKYQGNLEIYERGNRYISIRNKKYHIQNHKFIYDNKTNILTYCVNSSSKYMNKKSLKHMFEYFDFLGI